MYGSCYSLWPAISAIRAAPHKLHQMLYLLFTLVIALRVLLQLSRPGGGFIIAPEPILDHDQSDMEQSLSNVSSDLQVCSIDKGFMCDCLLLA